ncbi:MAG: calcium-binding EGF-like domain-containing protein [Chitinophagaceae bacterium]|nr:calcium-binding EGF-like domain-containing protein [Chitinophagaceae bacterium]
MKKLTLIFSTLVIFMMSVTLLLNSCKDPCKDIYCKNNGICRDGSCTCAKGYEGPFCQNKIYEKFIGTYEGSYRCNGSVPKIKNLIVAPGDLGNKVLIYNLFAQGEYFEATVLENKLEIARQTNNGVTFEGTGQIESNEYISIFITEDHGGGNTSSCIYNGTKFLEP